MNDETTSRSRRLRQHFLNATRPLGSTDEVADELVSLQRQLARAQVTLLIHRRIHQNATNFPRFFPFNDLRARIQREEDKRLAAVEDRVIQDFLFVLRRAASIEHQLRASAADVDAAGLICSDLVEALVLKALMPTLTGPESETNEPLSVSFHLELVTLVLAEVKLVRLDHTMDALIEDAYALATEAADIYANTVLEKRNRNR